MGEITAPEARNDSAGRVRFNTSAGRRHERPDQSHAGRSKTIVSADQRTDAQKWTPRTPEDFAVVAAEKEMEELRANITQKIEEKQDAIRNMQQAQIPSDPEARRLVGRISELRKQRNDLREALRAIVREIKLLDEERRKSRDEVSDKKKNMSFKSVSAVNEEIHRLESSFVGHAMSAHEERERVRKIRMLKKMRNDLAEIDAGANDSSPSVRIAELRQKKHEQDQQFSVITAELSQLSTDLEKIMPKDENQTQSREDRQQMLNDMQQEIEKMIEQRKALSDKIKLLRDAAQSARIAKRKKEETYNARKELQQRLSTLRKAVDKSLNTGSNTGVIRALIKSLEEKAPREAAADTTPAPEACDETLGVRRERLPEITTFGGKAHRKGARKQAQSGRDLRIPLEEAHLFLEITGSIPKTHDEAVACVDVLKKKLVESEQEDKKLKAKHEEDVRKMRDEMDELQKNIDELSIEIDGKVQEQKPDEGL